jgi:uncharacterized lipoprotein YbaY/heat shock protein HslJ
MVTRVLLAAVALMAAFASPAIAQNSSLMGSISYPEQVGKSRTAILEVTLEDVSAGDGTAVVVATSRVVRPGPSPVMFSLPYDGRVVPTNRYAVRARIIDGAATLFTSIRPVRVLTQGYGSFFALSLTTPEPVPAPVVSAPTAAAVPAPRPVAGPETPVAVPAPVKAQTPQSAPSVTAPIVTTPISAPTVVAPAVTGTPASSAAADVTRIAASAPAASAASQPKPAVSKPAASKPTATAPLVTGPAASKPTATAPVVTAPAPSKSAASSPAVTAPVAAKPAAPAPAASAPAASKPAAPKPVVSAPAASKPAASAPVTSAPVVTSAPKPAPATAPKAATGAKGASLATNVSTSASAAPAAPIAELPATFTGTLPCGDCPGIRYELTLAADATYAAKKTFEGSDRVQFEAGSWDYSSDRVVLVLKSSHDAWSWFAVRPDHVLRAVDSRGQSIGLRAPVDLRRSGAVSSTVATASRATAATSAPVTTALADALWTLTELGTKPVRPASKTHRAIVVAFDANARKFSGVTGCNVLEGDFNASWRTLTLTPTSPLPVCRIDQGTERAVSRTIKATRAYRITGTTLDLFDEQGARIARFEGVRR